MTSKERRDLYQEVADRITAELDAGRVPWHQPWGMGSHAHRNPVSGTVYRGINPLLLEMTALAAGYDDRRWVTFKQARSKDLTVRTGEHGAVVVFWKMLRVKAEDADGNETSRSVPMLRHYTVFNVAQLDGDLSALEAEREHEPEELPDALELLEAYIDPDTGGPTLGHDGNPDGAWYCPPVDHINLPAEERFDSSSHYYSTAFHEAVHSTGHPSRLNRVEIAKTEGKTREEYGREELTAEMGAAMLCALTGIEATHRQSVGYIQHWRDAIKADPKAVVLAAQRAQKAADLIAARIHDDQAAPTAA